MLDKHEYNLSILKMKFIWDIQTLYGGVELINLMMGNYSLQK